ncbi:MAG: 30S ribosomal protein S16 [Bdellovibrionales bacterium]|nr:30S ribosomal protein S16 [Bdellovibrionales bacterium]NQZ19141.1 30S ribosomal protein S16 [Bdellovibrionales bacterium]
MVVIRLARLGAKKRPKYRVTVADSRYFRNGRFIEVLGHYNPNPRGQEKEITLDLTKVKDWMSKGAQPSDRVKTLIKKAEASA